MKRYFVLASILMLVVFGCVKKVDLELERNAIRAADAAWSDATTAKNLDDFMKVVADDCVMMGPNAPAASGATSIREAMTQMLAMPGFDLSWSVTGVDVAASGDLGYSMGTYQFQMLMPDGSPMSDHGKYATIWKKQADGSWKVAVDIYNSDVPMAMPAAADSTGATGE